MTLPSSSRNGQRVRLVVLHTAEGSRTTDSLYSYFASTQAASCHAGIDENGVSDGWVPYDRAAWTLRNGNPYSDNAEICGFASWSREEWLKHPGMLAGAAAWVRARCLARGIPIVKLSPADVKAGKAGVCGHVDYTNATGDGTHWDPGPGFPWDIVISKASGEDDDVELSDKMRLFDGTENTVGNVLAGTLDRVAGKSIESKRYPGVKDNLAGFVSAMDANILTLLDEQRATNAKLDKLITLLTPKGA